MKEAEIVAGMHIWAVCNDLAAAAPATIEFKAEIVAGMHIWAVAPATIEFNGVRITSRVGETPETLATRWERQFKAQFEELQRTKYQQRLARVRQIISSASVDEAARVIVDELRPIKRYGR